MDYTDEELDDMMQEAELSSDDDGYVNLAAMKKLSADEAQIALKFGQNWESFAMLKSLMEKKSPVSLNFGIDEGSPYYQFETPPAKWILYLNKDIVRYLYNYFESGVLSLVRPSSYDGVPNATEKYVLHLLKRDRQNGKMVYEPETGYRAEYIGMSVNYGHLPYTPEELDAKLNLLA